MATSSDIDALQIISIVTQWGIEHDTQQRLGVFILLWSLFETELEKALWALAHEDVDGKKPSTDGPPASEWIKRVKETPSVLSEKSHAILNSAMAAAEDLMDYRHSILHGALVPFSTSAVSIRNASWYGERRKRPASEAHMDAHLLDMAITVAWTLCHVAVDTRAACNNKEEEGNLLALERQVNRAKSYASELLHLAQYVNNEKY
jgi:hypothetical protein